MNENEQVQTRHDSIRILPRERVYIEGRKKKYEQVVDVTPFIKAVPPVICGLAVFAATSPVMLCLFL